MRIRHAFLETLRALRSLDGRSVVRQARTIRENHVGVVVHHGDTVGYWTKSSDGIRRLFFVSPQTGEVVATETVAVLPYERLEGNDGFPKLAIDVLDIPSPWKRDARRPEPVEEISRILAEHYGGAISSVARLGARKATRLAVEIIMGPGGPTFTKAKVGGTLKDAITAYPQFANPLKKLAHDRWLIDKEPTRIAAEALEFCWGKSMRPENREFVIGHMVSSPREIWPNDCTSLVSESWIATTAIVASHLPRDWIPQGQEEWRAFVSVTSAVGETNLGDLRTRRESGGNSGDA